MLRVRVRESVRLDGNVRLCDSIPSPFILGIVAPKVYLPSNIAREDTEYVLSHERAHLRRGDHLWKPFGFLLLTVYWFNPLMWLSYVLMCRDIELACDEKVIKSLGEDNKKSYSMALLRCSAPRRLISACPVAFGEVGVKERIKRVLNYKRPAFWVILAALAATVAVAVCLMTNPVGKDDGITLTDEIQITEAGLHGNLIELHAGQALAKLTDEQIEELKTRLSGLQTGKKVDESVELYPCDIAVMTIAKGVPHKKGDAYEGISHVYEIFYKSDGTLLLRPPADVFYEVNDEEFIEYFKSLKPETDEVWDDYAMTKLSEYKRVKSLEVESENRSEIVTINSDNASFYHLESKDFVDLNTPEEYTSQTVKLNLSGIPKSVTLYRDKDGWLRRVESDADLEGFKASDPKSGQNDVIILSKLCASGFRQYYSYRTRLIDGSEDLSDTAVRSLIPDEAFGMTRKEAAKKLAAVKWSYNGVVNPSCTKLAYISNKCTKEDQLYVKTAVWIIDIETEEEWRLELPSKATRSTADVSLRWLDDENIAFSNIYGDGYRMNITTGELYSYYHVYNDKEYDYTFRLNSECENGIKLDFSGYYGDDLVSVLDIANGKNLCFNIEKLGVYPSEIERLIGDFTKRIAYGFTGYLCDGRYALFGLNESRCKFGIIDLEKEELRFIDWHDTEAPEYWQGKKYVISDSYLDCGKLCGDGYAIEIAELFKRGVPKPVYNPLAFWENYDYNGYIDLCSFGENEIGVDENGIWTLKKTSDRLRISAKIPKGTVYVRYGEAGVRFYAPTGDINNYFEFYGKAFLAEDLDAAYPENLRSIYYRRLFGSEYEEDKQFYREVVEEDTEKDGIFRYVLNVYTEIKPDYMKELTELEDGSLVMLQPPGSVGYMPVAAKRNENYYLIDLPVYYAKSGEVITTCTLPVYSSLNKKEFAQVIEEMDIRIVSDNDTVSTEAYKLTDCTIDPYCLVYYDTAMRFMTDIGFGCNHRTGKKFDASKYTDNEKFAEYLESCAESLGLSNELNDTGGGYADVTIKEMEVSDHDDYQTVTLNYECRWTYQDGTTGSSAQSVYFVTRMNVSGGVEILDFSDDPKAAGRDWKIPDDPDFWNDEEKYKPVLKAAEDRAEELRKQLGEKKVDELAGLLAAEGYSVHDIYSCEYVDEIGDIYCCSEILGEDDVEKWVDDVYNKLPADKQAGSLYRCVHDLGITQKQLKDYAKKYAGTNMHLPVDIIGDIFSLSYEEFLQKYVNPYAFLHDGKVYTAQQILDDPEAVREAVGSEALMEYGTYVLKPLLMRYEGESAYEKYYKDKVERGVSGICDADIRTCLDADLWFIDRFWYSDFEHDAEDSFTEDGITYYRVTEPQFSSNQDLRNIRSYIDTIYSQEMAAEMLGDPAIKTGTYYGWDVLYCADAETKKTDPRFTARTDGKLKPSNEHDFTFEWSYLDDSTSEVSVHAFFKTSDKSETVDELYILTREQSRWKIKKRGENGLILN